MAAALLLPTALGAASLAGAMSIPGGDFSGWLQVCAPKSFPDPTSQEADKIRRDAKNGDASNVWGHCKNEVAEADRALLAKELLRIEVEAGKTYYVKWHVPYKPGTPLPKMVLVDEATGAAEDERPSRYPVILRHARQPWRARYQDDVVGWHGCRKWFRLDEGLRRARADRCRSSTFGPSPLTGSRRINCSQARVTGDISTLPEGRHFHFALTRLELLL